MTGSSAPYPKKTVTVAGGPVTYYETGAGKPLIYLHSGGGFRFTRAMALLAEHLHLYALVMPGFDGTPVHESIQGSQDVGRVVCDVIGALGLAKASVLGFSIGAHVAAWTAAHCTGKIDHLILAAAAGLRPPHLGAPNRPPMNTPEERAKYLSAHPERMPAERRTPETMTSDAAMIARYSQGKFYDEALAEKLPHITCPTLIIYGTQERAVPIESSFLIKEKIPNSFLMFIHDAGHNVEIDQPERFAKIAGDFVERGAGSVTGWPRRFEIGEAR